MKLYHSRIQEKNNEKGIAGYLRNTEISFTPAKNIKSLDLRMKIYKGKTGMRINPIY